MEVAGCVMVDTDDIARGVDPRPEVKLAPGTSNDVKLPPLRIDP